MIIRSDLTEHHVDNLNTAIIFLICSLPTYDYAPFILKCQAEVTVNELFSEPASVLFY